MPTKDRLNIIQEIDNLSDEINKILDEKLAERYFEGIVLLYSFIEDILRWLVFAQIIWNKSSKRETRSANEIDQVRVFCNQSNLFTLLRLALSVDLLDYQLYEKLTRIREERNSLIHQYWIYTHKGKRLIFRKKLERLATTANELVGKSNRLVRETGADDSYGIFQVSRSRSFVSL